MFFLIIMDLKLDALALDFHIHGKVLDFNFHAFLHPFFLWVLSQVFGQKGTDALYHLLGFRYANLSTQQLWQQGVAGCCQCLILPIIQRSE